MTDAFVSLQTAWARARVYRTGALLTNAALRLPDGRWVKPLAEAPWAGEPQPPGVPGHLERLGGEFFCLPFGGGGDALDPAPGYEPLATGEVDQPMHGPAANAVWSVVASDQASVTMVLELPEPHAVARLKRTIRLDADRPLITFEMRIEARRAARVPAGFHPILKLPERTQALLLEADFATGFTYPATHAHRRTTAAPASRFARLDAVPGHGGQTADFSSLPPGGKVEDNILMAGSKGPVRATFLDEGFTLTVDWSRAELPHCMIWQHDRARDEVPWRGRYRGLGVEPIAACFDGPWELSAGDNPLARSGYATALAVDPARATALWCSFAVTPAKG